jgi:hypothetical protein
MLFHHVRNTTNFLFNVLSGGCCSEYLATAVFFEENNLFDRLNGGTCVDQEKTLHCPHSDNSPPYRSLEKGKYGDKQLDLPQGW